MNFLKEFILYIDIVLIELRFCAKILFFLGWYEKIIKIDAQVGVTDHPNNSIVEIG